MKRTTLSIMLLSTAMLLTGCGDESNQTSNTATTQSVEKEPTQKACYNVGETTSLERDHAANGKVSTTLLFTLKICPSLNTQVHFP
jgi:PBP1b-binding outer membrane lipoprotein LpoB